ncbi:hypothetical protein CaCOL14_000410 [Colletotrichum acutatum]
MSVASHTLGASASGAGSMDSMTLAGASAAVATMLNEIEDFSDSDLLAVYGKEPGQVVPQILGYTIKDRHWIEPTRNGSGKAAALFEIVPTDPSSRCKALVIAIRGSSSSIDWLVNLNSDLVECPDLVTIPESRLKPTPKVHRGFAKCARTIAPGLVDQIKTALDENQTQDQEIEIVFTGHSAGGAVACLLFCYVLTRQILNLSSRKVTLSCVTFGCPPLFNTDIDSRLAKLYTSSNFLLGNMLAFANDGDPISRMDAAYATELARIWYRVGGSKCPPASEFPDFKPPKLRLNGLGQLVVLFEKEQEEDENKEDEDIEEEETLMACRLSHSDLEHQAWANVAAHRMNQYVKWMTCIGDGSFNGRRDWTDHAR